MGSDDKFDLADAYSVESPEDNRKLYRKWADTYESDFLVNRGYVYHETVSAAFLADSPSGPVLDVGCGTGVVGSVLGAAGLGPIDGIDISAEMLAKASEKSVDGAPLYRNLVEADLTDTIPIESDRYQSVISVGTFTIGHLPPESLGELIRVAAPGARFGIGVNAQHYEAANFEDWLNAQISSGVIGPFQITEVPMYDGGEDDHAGDTAKVVRFAVTE